MDDTTAQATNAVAAMRALPWGVSPACWPAAPLAAVHGVGTPVRAGDAIRPMSGVDYALSASAITTIGQDVRVVRGHDADHKFSPRLGPTASPPV